MPRDSNGSYSLPSGTLVSTGDTILVSQHNPAMQDIATSLTNSLARTGAGGMLADLNMGGNDLVNVGSVNVSGDSDWNNYSIVNLANIVLTGGGRLSNGGTNRLVLKNDASSKERLAVSSSGVVHIGGARAEGGVQDYPGSGNLRVVSATAGGYAISTFDTQDYIAVQFTRDVAGVTSQVGTITCAVSSTSYNTASDERLKTNFRSFDSGSLLDALWVGAFDWKAGGTGFGVRAQQAHPIFPSAITPGEGSTPWQADYSKFVPLLLNEVKALRARVAALEAR